MLVLNHSLPILGLSDLVEVVGDLRLLERHLGYDHFLRSTFCAKLLEGFDGRLPDEALVEAAELRERRVCQSRTWAVVGGEPISLEEGSVRRTVEAPYGRRD